MGRGITLSLTVVLGLTWINAAGAEAADGRRPLLANLFGRPMETQVEMSDVAPAPAVVAGGRRPLLGPIFRPADVRVETPEGVSVGPPGPQRYPEHSGGNYPWYGYGFGVPTYNWGYFGAHYRPMSVCHTGYYNQYVQWGYRRGY